LRPVRAHCNEPETKSLSGEPLKNCTHGEIGEVGRLMGFGTRRVLIPDGLATIENDRVTLTIPSDRVNDLLEAGQ
jgi:hypothetical protein